LVYGLLLLKNKQRDAAIKHFDEIHGRHPTLLLPLQAIAWGQFEKGAIQAGVEELAELVSKTPKPKKPADPYSEAAQQMFHWAGQLREYAALAVEQRGQTLETALASLDTAIADHGEKSLQSYEAGRAKSRAVHREYEQQIEGATDRPLLAKLKIERRQMARYVAFPYEQASQQILAALNE
jgi:hypothetical protein